MSVRRLSAEPEMRQSGAELVEEYLRLPDGWAAVGGVPTHLPPALGRVVDEFPGPAAPPSGDVLLSLAGTTLVGQVLLVRHDEISARIERLHVRDGWTRQGRGRELVDAALGLAADLGYRRVVLDVLPERRAAVRIYESFGFVPIDPYAEYPMPMLFMAVETRDH